MTIDSQIGYYWGEERKMYILGETDVLGSQVRNCPSQYIKEILSELKNQMIGIEKASGHYKILRKKLKATYQIQKTVTSTTGFDQIFSQLSPKLRDHTFFDKYNPVAGSKVFERKSMDRTEKVVIPECIKELDPIQQFLELKCESKEGAFIVAKKFRIEFLGYCQQELGLRKIISNKELKTRMVNLTGKPVKKRILANNQQLSWINISFRH